MIVQNVLDLPRLLVSNLIQYKYSSIDSFQHFREGMTVDWRKKLEEVGSTQEEVLSWSPEGLLTDHLTRHKTPNSRLVPLDHSQNETQNTNWLLAAGLSFHHDQP